MLNLDQIFINENEPENSEKYVSKCSQIRPIVKYNVSIEKNIFQTWKTHQVPDKWKVSPESIKSIMSDWNYILFDDFENRAFVEKYFPDFLPYYDAFPYNIQRADAIRYCFLYIYGGIYMDLDFELQTDLSILFQSSCEIFLVKSGNIGSYYTNSFMASRSGSKFWLEVIEEMKKPLPWYIMGKHFQVMCSTGPLMLSRVAGRTSTVVGNIPARLVMPCSICNINCSTCEAYLRPLEGSSWTSYDTAFLNFWLCHWKKVIAFLICLLILLLFTWLLYKFKFVEGKLWPPSRALDIFFKK